MYRTQFRKVAPFRSSSVGKSKRSTGRKDFSSLMPDRQKSESFSSDQKSNTRTNPISTPVRQPFFNRGDKKPFSGNVGRPSFGGARGFSSNRRSSGNRGVSQNIHFSKFINKAIPNEVVEKFVPENLFKDFKVDERLKKNICDKGYCEPTPVQDKIIPYILKGSDVVGIANTGTGKTAAYLIPLIQKVLLNPKEEILIVVPTRELAVQIDQELKSFTSGFKIYSVCCVGGMPIGRQISELRYWNNFIIGTPGRIKDLVDRKAINLSPFSTIVLDEADRMLDMGFIADMRLIMSKMSKTRHTLFFSATMSKEVEKLIKDFLNNPVTVSVKTGDTAKNVDQDIVKVTGKEKIDVLHDLLTKPEFGKVLIFGRTKHGVERLSNTLVDRGFRADSIHGDKNQPKRDRALRQFKDNNINILVATDVAARGIDVADITHVINYDIPATYDDYVHRIGRTGRGSKKGKAITFV